MPNTLLTAVSGLITHQRKLDVVANNLSNMNTPGFKTQRVTFSDLFYELVTPATSGNGVSVGGTNPLEVGSGVRLAQVTRKFGQGPFEATGQALDFALQGDGFFVVNDGQRNLYTRSGAFSLDERGYLVDPMSGFHVQRFGSVGEPTGTGPSFQTPGNNNILVPLGQTILGEATSNVDFTGILSSEAEGPQAAVLTSASPFQTTSGAATAATLLNDLTSNIVDYTGGDVINISGTDADGTTFSVNVNADGTTTLGDLVTAINGAVTQSTATIDASGNLLLTANQVGSSLISLVIDDASGNTGQTTYYNHAFVTTTTGTDGDKFTGSLDVYDVRGGAHDLYYSFQKTSDSEWSLTFTMAAGDGTVTSAPITGILFADDGQLIGINGVPLTNAQIDLQIDGIVAPQSVIVDLSDLKHIATDFSMSTSQDGLAPSKLSSVRIDSDGTLQGITSNGQVFNLAQLAIALFRNPQGLSGVGQSYYEGSLNSGDVELGAGGSDGRGTIRAGQLEGSNVDVAFEFTQLIVAQRGFSANARTISVADEVLEELTNIIR